MSVVYILLSSRATYIWGQCMNNFSATHNAIKSRVLFRQQRDRGIFIQYRHKGPCKTARGCCIYHRIAPHIVFHTPYVIQTTHPNIEVSFSKQSRRPSRNEWGGFWVVHRKYILCFRLSFSSGNAYGTEIIVTSFRIQCIHQHWTTMHLPRLYSPTFIRTTSPSPCFIWHSCCRHHMEERLFACVCVREHVICKPAVYGSSAFTKIYALDTKLYRKMYRNSSQGHVKNLLEN